VSEYTYKYNRPKGYFYPKQEAMIDAPQRLTVCFGGTKSGKTASHAIWLTEQAFKGEEGDFYLWVSPSHETSKIAFDLIVNMLKKGGIEDFQTNNQFHSIKLFNGTTMRFVGSTNYDSIYGYGYQAVVVDEGSRCSDEAWEACQSTTTFTQCQIKVVGNVTSKNTWMYKLHQNILDGNIRNAAAFTITVWDACDAGVLSKEHLLELKQTYTRNKWLALFECVATEDLANPFGIDNIRKCIISRDIDDRLPVAYGVDLAKSVDNTVIAGLNINNELIVCDLFQKDWGETKDRIKRTVGKVATMVDSTGVGDPICEELQETMSNIVGLKFTQKSKEQLIDGLVMAIQEHAIAIPDKYIELIRQLENFETTITATGLVRYSGKRTGGDDCVMALALAWKMSGNAINCSLLPQIIETQLEQWQDEDQWIALEDYGESMLEQGSLF